MAAVQIRDIFDQIRRYHHQLAQYYRRAGQSSNDEKHKFLLDYMGRHEDRIEEALSDYGVSAGKSVLDTWIQFVPQTSLQAVFDQATISPQMTPDDVVAQALALDRKLIDYYKLLTDSTSAYEVRELFMNLIANEDAKDHQYAKCLLGIDGE
jgi:hypothetical protein